MKINKEGLDLIKEFEGFYSKSYYCPAGELTIGYGTTNADSAIIGTKIKEGMTISKETATEWLEKSINKKYTPLVEKYQKIYHFNGNQFSALVSFAYNIGSIDGLTANGTRSIATIKKKILEYNKANGKELKGLTRRRQAELALFNKKPEKVKYTGTLPSFPLLRSHYKNGDGIKTLTKYTTQIKRVQKCLNFALDGVKGFARLSVDGQYGNATEKAVRLFQTRYKFKDVNGKWGKLCNAQMKNGDDPFVPVFLSLISADIIDLRRHH